MLTRVAERPLSAARSRGIDGACGSWQHTNTCCGIHPWRLVKTRGMLRGLRGADPCFRLLLQKSAGVAAATRTSRRMRGSAPTSSGLLDDFREPSDGEHAWCIEAEVRRAAVK